MKSALILTIGLMTAFTAQAFEMGVSASQIPPIANVYYTKDGAKIRETGILYLLGQYIARHTNEVTSYRVVPRDQVATKIKSGDLQSICYMTPKWLGLKGEEALFTKPFLVAKESLISRKSIPLIREKSHLRGLTVGLIAGFKYPKLQNMIDTEYFTVEYHNNEVNNFISLFRDSHVDAIVFKDLAFRHFARTMPEIVDKKPITIHPYTLGESSVSCAVSVKSKRYLPLMNQAIDDYLRDYPL